MGIFGIILSSVIKNITMFKFFIGGVSMIVYSATKAEFNNDVKYNQISDKILMKLHEANKLLGMLSVEWHS